MQCIGHSLQLLDGFSRLLRAKKVLDGVNHASKMFPKAYLIMVLIGAVKGNGQSIIKIGERLGRGVWTPEAVEVLRPAL